MTCFVFFALMALAAVAVEGRFLNFRRRPFHHFRPVGFPTFADARWCRANCYFNVPFYQREYCFRYCYRNQMRSFLQGEPTCGQFFLMEPQHSCENVTGTFKISFEDFKGLNPEFKEEKCDATPLPAWKDILVCVKPLGPGEEPQPLPCQQHHSVGFEKTCKEVEKLYKDIYKLDVDLAKLNPTVNCEDVHYGQVLCAIRDPTRALPPPCDRFYPFTSLDLGETDCSAVVRRFVEGAQYSLTLEEYNRLNPDHPCDPASPEKLVPGQMVCLRSATAGGFLEVQDELAALGVIIDASGAIVLVDDADTATEGAKATDLTTEAPSTATEEESKTSEIATEAPSTEESKATEAPPTEEAKTEPTSEAPSTAINEESKATEAPPTESTTMEGAPIPDAPSA